MAVDRYTHGHHSSVVAQHSARTAEDCAKFLLPHLQEDFSLLDVGCGPGSITRGFAKYVKFVKGVDNSETVIAQARDADTGECGEGNVEFETASPAPSSRALCKAMGFGLVVLDSTAP